MTQGQTRRWKRSSLIVLAGLIALIVSAAVIITALDYWQKHQRLARWRSETAYREGPFRKFEWLLPSLNALPGYASLRPSGLRFVAKPELQAETYAAAFRLLPRKESASVELIIDRRPYQKPAMRSHYDCILRSASYRSMIYAIDERLDRFTGDDDGVGTDGTSLAFERVRGNRVTSGGGNFSEPYRGLGEIVLARLREACPKAPLPQIGEDWYKREGEAG